MGEHPSRMVSTWLTLVLVATGIAALAPGVTGSASAATAHSTVWLCKPGTQPDPCTADRTATVIKPDGSRTTEHPKKTKQPVDCFYVYPTVSNQPGPNANLHIDQAEISVAVAQASRFSQVCKVYAPMYRQLTLSTIGGPRGSGNAASIAYSDVQAAWKDYLAHDNHGRGVVLIGHSQGAGMLEALIRNTIDNSKSARKKLVSAILLGGNVTVPKGKSVGGTFEHVKTCKRATQTGCVVAYSSFAATPPDNTLFGKPSNAFGRSNAPVASLEVVCTNPANLGSGAAAPLHPYAPTHLPLGEFAAAEPEGIASIRRPWAAYPTSVTGQCKTNGQATWLQISPATASASARPQLKQTLGPTWGLHLIDVNVALGDLVKLVGRESAAYRAKVHAQ
jgi:hypothetical protein